MSPRRWLYIRVTIKHRELDGAILLACQAAVRGWGVILGRDPSSVSGVRFPPGVWLDKGLTPGRWKAVGAAQSAGHRVAAICEEGLIYSDVEEYGRRHLDRKAFDLLDLYFAWGRRQHADLVNRLGCSPDKIRIVGNPRLDLHRPEFARLLVPQAKRLQERWGPYILITTKFSKYNANVPFERKLAGARRKGKVQSAADEAQMIGLREFHRVGFECFQAMVPALSRRYPGQRIVVRPHPSENFASWQEAVRGLPNVDVVFEGNVAAWIAGADVVIHNNCTTGVEAFLLGRPTVCYRPISEVRYDMFLPNALTAGAISLDDVFRFIDQARNQQDCAWGNSRDDLNEILYSFLENAGGRPAASSMLDAFAELSVPVSPLSVRVDMKGLLRGRVRRAVRAVRQYPGFWRHAGGKGSHTRATDPIYPEEVADFVRRLQAMDQSFAGVRSIPLSEGLFCLHT